MARDLWDDKTPQGYFDRAAALWTNAHRLLGALKVGDDGRYRKAKRMREACGTGWLAAQEAIKGLVRKKGVAIRKLPKEIDTLGQALDEAQMDGRAQKWLENAYHQLHIGGYYEGFRAADAIALGMEGARQLVERIAGVKLPRRG